MMGAPSCRQLFEGTLRERYPTALSSPILARNSLSVDLTKYAHFYPVRATCSASNLCLMSRIILLL